MASSPDILLADEIVAALQVSPFNLNTERLYVPDWSVKDELETLKVGVWPEEATADSFERVGLLRSFPIAVGFAKRLTQKTRLEVDGLLDTVWSVVSFLELKTVAMDDGSKYINTGWEFRLRFNMDSLDREKRDGQILYTGHFASVVSFPFLQIEAGDAESSS